MSTIPPVSETTESLPPLADLISVNAKVSNRAWEDAYRLLWQWGMRVAHRKMAGPSLEQAREDVVALSISQFQAEVFKKAGQEGSVPFAG